MVNVHMSLTGVLDIARIEDQIVLSVNEQLGELANEIAATIEEGIRVRTGDLQSTVRVDDTGDGYQVAVGYGEIDYAIPLDAIYGLMADGTTFEEIVEMVVDGWDPDIL